jgi:hypothetical protein
VVHPLVEVGQHRVQRGGRALEDLVQERHVRGGGVAVEYLPVGALRERGDVDRAEDRRRGGELGQQDFPVVSRSDPRGDLADDGGLAGAGRAQQQRVLAGQDAGDDHAGLGVPLVVQRGDLADRRAQVSPKR